MEVHYTPEVTERMILAWRCDGGIASMLKTSVYKHGPLNSLSSSVSKPKSNVHCSCGVLHPSVSARMSVERSLGIVIRRWK